MGMTFAVQRHSPVLTSFLWLAAEAERERDFSIMQGPVLSSGFRATVCTRLQTQSCPAFLCSQESTNESALEKRVHCPIGQLQFSRSRRQRSWPLCNGRDWRWDKHHELLPGTRPSPLPRAQGWHASGPLLSGHSKFPLSVRHKMRPADPNILAKLPNVSLRM